MGAGEVWIDDVQLYDMYFLKREGQELRIRIAVHESLVARNRWLSAFEFLDSFWPQLLFARADQPVPRTARDPSATEPPAAADDAGATSEEDPSLLDRIKPKWPKLWFPF